MRKTELNFFIVCQFDCHIQCVKGLLKKRKFYCTINVMVNAFAALS